MTLKHEEPCKMESRVVKLEAKTCYLDDESDDHSQLIKENTEAINKLCKTLVEHEVLLRESQKMEGVKQTLIIGIVVGVIVFVIQEVGALI